MTLPRTPEPAVPVQYDGWTIDRRLQFIRQLALTRNVRRAAASAGMSPQGAYRLRQRDRAFAQCWQLALAWHEAARRSGLFSNSRTLSPPSPV